MDIRHLELFSGIGGFRQALYLLSKDFDINPINTAFSEIDTYAIKTYKANFTTLNEVEIGDIVSFVQEKTNILKLSDFDILSGGFPCQYFSMMGKQNGFKDMRGNVFFQILEILKNKQPKFVLLENVKNLQTHDKGKTLNIILDSLKNLGYNVFHDIFNTKNFSLAQNRSRLYIFATKEKTSESFIFTSKEIEKSFKTLENKSTIQHQYIFQVLDKEVDKKYYLSEIIKPTILANGSKNFISKSDINQLVARPLTATMAKMHRACQDNYFSDEFIQNENPLEYANLQFSKEELAKKQIRRLTPKEAFILQGFSSDFFENTKQTGVSDSQLYKQAGNAVSVNTVYAIFYYLFIKHKLLEA